MSTEFAGHVEFTATSRDRSCGFLMPTITTGFCSIDKKFKAPKVKAQTGLATRLLLIPSYEADVGFNRI